MEQTLQSLTGNPATEEGTLLLNRLFRYQGRWLVALGHEIEENQSPFIRQVLCQRAVSEITRAVKSLEVAIKYSEKERLSVFINRLNEGIQVARQVASTDTPQKNSTLMNDKDLFRRDSRSRARVLGELLIEVGKSFQLGLIRP
jgi:hypothetical protein